MLSSPKRGGALGKLLVKSEAEPGGKLDRLVEISYG
jgi:hypothetical protein